MIIDNVNILFYLNQGNKLFTKDNIYCIEFDNINGNMIKRIFCNKQDIFCIIDDLNYLITEDNNIREMNFVFYLSDDFNKYLINITNLYNGKYILSLYKIVYIHLDYIPILNINVNLQNLNDILIKLEEIYQNME